jgi:hypothetical protein
VIRRLPGGQLQNSHLLPAAKAADIGRQSGILADGASFVVLNIPCPWPEMDAKVGHFQCKSFGPLAVALLFRRASHFTSKSTI